MVVSDLGALLCFINDSLKFGRREPHRADPHRRAVAIAVIGLRIAGKKPFPEKTSISGIGISPAVFPENFRIFPSAQNAVSNSDSHDSVVGKPATRIKKIEIRCLYIFPFVDRTDDVACYSAYHDYSFFTSFWTQAGLLPSAVHR